MCINIFFQKKKIIYEKIVKTKKKYIKIQYTKKFKTPTKTLL